MIIGIEDSSMSTVKRVIPTLVLRMTLDKPIGGYWDGGLKSVFDFTVQREYSDGMSRVGSYEMSQWFEVKTGKTEKQTLSNIKRKKLANGIHVTWEYIPYE